MPYHDQTIQFGRLSPTFYRYKCVVYFCTCIRKLLSFLLNKMENTQLCTKRQTEHSKNERYLQSRGQQSDINLDFREEKLKKHMVLIRKQKINPQEAVYRNTRDNIYTNQRESLRPKNPDKKHCSSTSKNTAPTVKKQPKQIFV